MEVQAQIRKNTDDIHALTVSVTKLTAIVENSEKRHDQDLDVIRQAVQGINDLNARMSATIGMEKDIGSLREMLGEKVADIRTIRHDLNTVMNALQGISIVSEKVNEASVRLADHEARINAIESWKDKIEGGATVIKTGGKWFWAVFGGVVTAIISGVLAFIFGGGRGIISGE